MEDEIFVVLLCYLINRSRRYRIWSVTDMDILLHNVKSYPSGERREKHEVKILCEVNLSLKLDSSSESKSRSLTHRHETHFNIILNKTHRAAFHLQKCNILVQEML